METLNPLTPSTHEGRDATRVRLRRDAMLALLKLDLT